MVVSIGFIVSTVQICVEPPVSVMTGLPASGTGFREVQIAIRKDSARVWSGITLAAWLLSLPRPYAIGKAEEFVLARVDMALTTHPLELAPWEKADQ